LHLAFKIGRSHQLSLSIRRSPNLHFLRPLPARTGQLARILPAACWAHARRALFEAHESTNSPIAEEALRRIQELYAIEAEIHGRSAADRHVERQARSKPVLTDLKTWMEVQRRRASGNTLVGKALSYASIVIDASSPWVFRRDENASNARAVLAKS
jgi:hypothetical protein